MTILLPMLILTAGHHSSPDNPGIPGPMGKRLVGNSAAEADQLSMHGLRPQHGRKNGLVNHPEIPCTYYHKSVDLSSGKTQFFS
jgi:hypothetical protein